LSRLYLKIQPFPFLSSGKQLKRTEDEGLVRVANTYNKWKIEIANAITVRNENGKRYSNGPAEGLNNAIKNLTRTQMNIEISKDLGRGSY